MNPYPPPRPAGPIQRHVFRHVGAYTVALIVADLLVVAAVLHEVIG